MKPWILAVVVGTLIVIVAVVVFVLTGLGGTIKAVVEHVGSQATGTEVTLRSADVSLASGEGRLSGLVVGNPKGFATKNAFELGDIRLSIDTSTVTSDVVVIREIVIDGPHVTYELGTGGSNVGIIQANLERFSGGDASAAKAPVGKKAAVEKADERRYIVGELRVTNGLVEGSTTLVKDQKVSAKLPEIRLRDLGKAKGGATSGELAKEILLALTHASLEAAEKKGLDALMDRVGEKLGGALKGVLGK
jgi:hypothetical protein